MTALEPLDKVVYLNVFQNKLRVVLVAVSAFSHSFLGSFLQLRDQLGIDLRLSGIRLGFRSGSSHTGQPGHAGIANVVASTAAAEIVESLFIVLTSVCLRCDPRGTCTSNRIGLFGAAQ